MWTEGKTDLMVLPALLPRACLVYLWDVEYLELYWRYDTDKSFWHESDIIWSEKVGKMGRISLTLESENDRIGNML